MKKIIHVNQHVIKSNSKNNETKPVLSCKHTKIIHTVMKLLFMDKM